MKKIFFYLAAATVTAASLTACSDDDEQFVLPQPAVQAESVVLNGTVSAKNSIVANLNTAKANWVVGDTIAVYAENTKDTVWAKVTEVASNGAATIEAKLNRKAAGLVKLIYPASLATAAGDVNTAQLAVGQTGTAAAAARYAVLTGAAYLTAADSTAALNVAEWAEQTALSEFTVSDGEKDITANVTRLSVSGQTVNYAVEPDGQSKIYLVTLPMQAVTTATVTIKDADNQEHSYASPIEGIAIGKTDNSFEISLKNAQNVKELKDVTVADLGKIIAADGKVYVAGTPGIQGIAMVAYVGAVGSVDADSTQFRGLAIALDNAGVASWFGERRAQHVFQSDNFTAHWNAASGTYGDLKGYRNTLVLADSCFDITSRTLHLADTIQVADTTQVADSTLVDGVMKAVDGTLRDSIFNQRDTLVNLRDSVVYDSVKHVHPAAELVKKYAVPTPEGAGQWFLPTSGQWVKVLGALGTPVAAWKQWGTCPDDKGAAYTAVVGWLQQAGDKTIESGQWFWSSSEYSDEYAVGVGFYKSVGVNVSRYQKTEQLNVRPFFAF